MIRARLMDTEWGVGRAGVSRGKGAGIPQEILHNRQSLLSEGPQPLRTPGAEVAFFLALHTASPCRTPSRVGGVGGVTTIIMDTPLTPLMTDLETNTRTLSHEQHIEQEKPHGSEEMESQNLPPLTPRNAEASANKNKSNNEWKIVNRQNTRKRNMRLIKKYLTIDDIFKKEEHFDSHFIVSFPGINISTDLDIIRTSDEIKQTIGKPKRMIRSGKSALLIETFDGRQSDKLTKISQIAGHTVKIEKHKHYNTVKGVVRSKAFGHNTIEQIAEDLKNQGVTDVRRVSLRRNEETIKTDTYILSFNLTKLPPIIIFGEFHRELVEEYKYKPQQCFKCQRYGHVAKYCRSEVDICSRCGQQGHVTADCNNSIKCYHCAGSHNSNSKECQKYTCEMNVLETQMRERIPRGDAVEIVLSQHPEYERFYSNTGRPSANRRQPTAAAIVAGRTNDNNQPETTIVSPTDNTMKAPINVADKEKQSSNKTSKPSRSSTTSNHHYSTKTKNSI